MGAVQVGGVGPQHRSECCVSFLVRPDLHQSVGDRSHSVLELVVVHGVGDGTLGQGVDPDCAWVSGRVVADHRELIQGPQPCPRLLEGHHVMV